MPFLAFYSSTNTKGRHDATGAFIPEVKRFAKLHSLSTADLVPVKCVGVPRERRAAVVTERLRGCADGSLAGVAFFCHGWPSGIQFGFDLQNVGALARLLAVKTESAPVVVLYACLTAENAERDQDVENVGPGTDGGFADALRDRLAEEGKTEGWVDAHKTAGHSTWNPFLVRFRLADVEDRQLGGVGGEWIVAPGSEHWHEWRRRLACSEDALRYRFPFLTTFQIKTDLQKCRF